MHIAALALLLVAPTLAEDGPAYGTAEEKHEATLLHIKKADGVTVVQLMDHLADVHAEHWKKKRGAMLAVVDGLGNDIASRDADGDGAKAGVYPQSVSACRQRLSRLSRLC